jgi:hypothetical protein
MTAQAFVARVVVALLGLMLLFVAQERARAEETASGIATPNAPLEEVLVTGEQAGPGLWKVIRTADGSGHVLWILGTYGPLPKNMKWRSAELEAAIAKSQELLAPAEVDAEVGVLGRLAVLPSLIGVRNNPGDKMLRDVLPADLYARWLPLKNKYLRGNDSVEKWRPIFAAFELYQKAINKVGLERSTVVWATVKKLARKHKLKVTTPTVDVKVEKARSAVKEFKREPLDDVACFSRVIERLESDLGVMRVRANAWATGDVEALRASLTTSPSTSCIAALMKTQVVQQRGYADIPERVKDAWVAAAERALRENASTVAVLWMNEILGADGYVAALRAKGYIIEEPR